VSNETARPKSDERGNSPRSGPDEVSHRNSGNGRGRSGLSQTSERDPMVFGFIIAYLGRPRRIIAHEDSTRCEIYGRTRCNSPTETGRHSQINSERRHESPSSPPTRVPARARTRAHTGARARRVNPRARELRRVVKLRDQPGSCLSLFLSFEIDFHDARRGRGILDEGKMSSRSTRFPIIKQERVSPALCRA